MPYRDRAAQNEYQRKWYAARRAAWFLDKVCVDCGSNIDLELDHLDRSKKISHRVWSWSGSPSVSGGDGPTMCWMCIGGPSTVYRSRRRPKLEIVDD